MSRTPGATKVRMHDRQPGALPVELRNTPPLVIWRHQSCRSRLLRLFLSPDGWLLITDDVRVSLPEWIERTGLDATVEDFREGRFAAFSAREVKGHERLLPHETSRWPSGLFEIGCRKHGMGRYALGDLARDADEARMDRHRVERLKVPVDA